MEHKHFQTIFAGVAALAGLSTFIIWLETRHERNMKNQLLNLEHEIKSIQLYNIKNGNPHDAPLDPKD